MERSKIPPRMWMAQVPDALILPPNFAKHAPATCPDWILGWKVSPDVLADREAAALLYRLAKIAIARRWGDWSLDPETCFAASESGQDGVGEHPSAYDGADFFIAVHWFADQWATRRTPLHTLSQWDIYKPGPFDRGPHRAYEYDPPEEGADDIDERLEAEVRGECPDEYGSDDYDGTVRDLYLEFVYHIFGHWPRVWVDQDEWEARVPNWGLGGGGCVEEREES